MITQNQRRKSDNPKLNIKWVLQLGVLMQFFSLNHLILVYFSGIGKHKEISNAGLQTLVH